MCPRDEFEASYTAGVTEEDPDPAALAPSAPPAHDDHDLPMAMPAEPFALEGTVLSAEHERRRAWVVLGEPQITDIVTTKPQGVKIFKTGNSVVLPGMIDLHGHPEYNVFAPWEPPKLYANRQRWRDSPEYEQLVKAPYRELKAAGLVDSLTRYAEIRALVGGVTAIQGAAVPPGTLAESLVRNIDRRLFGEHRARSIIDIGGQGIDKVRAAITAGKVDRVYVHVAEGVDQTSRNEFDRLADDTVLFGEHAALIHGTALDTPRLQQVADAGAKLIWSPQSNLRLYAQTTDIKQALALGIAVGIGADWVPSGSSSTLAELRVARHALAAQGVDDDPRRLVGMVTWDAAAIAGLTGKLGDLKPGMPADLVVLERCNDDPWESVLRSDPSAVQLVMIGGNIVYARSDWYDELAEDSPTERIPAWGREVTLDTAYSVNATPSPAPRLADLRGELLAKYVNLGPIFA